MPTKVRLQLNTPLHLDVRFCDVVRGEQTLDIKFKGRNPAGGDDLLLYLDHDRCLQALLDADLLAPVPAYSFDRLPDKGVALDLLVPRLTFLLEQHAGSSGPSLRITPWGARAQTSAEPGRRNEYLTVMEFVATVCVPEYVRLHGRAPDDAAIVRMQQSLFLQTCRDLDDDRRRSR